MVEKEGKMSTYFAIRKEVRARDLFDGRLEDCGIREEVFPSTDECNRCLTDGRNRLWVSIDSNGLVTVISSDGLNVPSKILDAIAKTFETEIFSEHEYQYWGYSTEEEWDADMRQMADVERDKFYNEVCAYIRGEDNGIIPRTIGEKKAKIAKTLVEKDPTLLQADHKDRLMTEMEAIYNRDHAVVVTLGPEDLALVQLLARHEDDLPQA